MFKDCILKSSISIIPAKSYDDFIVKWVGRNLYEALGNTCGRITKYRDEKYRLNSYKIEIVIADVFLLPTIQGWKDEKQRRAFYADAKRVGVRKQRGTKNEWYKLIDYVDKGFQK